MEDKAVAAVVFHSPSFLLDIAPENHTKLRFEATERHVPAAYKMMTDSVALRELPAKYDKTISAVRGSFYLPPVCGPSCEARTTGLTEPKRHWGTFSWPSCRFFLISYGPPPQLRASTYLATYA
ncbi:hypothetical protein [Nitrosomonas sp. Nm132]|uniref:hypothetical protein n=1 Tax=Nitrosomonas sp. Nm132 TaxID=1881053 RepID=UPI00115FCDAF|nr:hypothetical protein [Nitrosomonas sp. Nm132]